MSTPQLELVLERLAGAGIDMRETGAGRWRGGCPACGKDDRLTVQTDLNGNVWAQCWSATCEPADILNALNLTWQQLTAPGEADAAGTGDDARFALFEEPLGLGDKIRPREQVPGGAELIYRGQSAVLFSERGHGKSSVATLLAVAAAAQGERVYYWDRENGRDLTGRRVEAILDAYPDWPDVRECAGGLLAYREYPRLNASWTPQDVARAFEGFGLVIYDSLREAIAQLGGNPDTEESISKFVALCVTPVLMKGGSVLVSDNVGHEATHRPKGSASKLDAIPQAFKVTAVRPFSEVSLGQIEIVCTRSRFGDLDRVWSMAIGAGTWELPCSRTENPDHRAAREIANAKSSLHRVAVEALRVRQPQGWKALAGHARDAGLRKRAIILKGWLEELAADPSRELPAHLRGVLPEDSGSLRRRELRGGSQQGFPHPTTLGVGSSKTGDVETVQNGSVLGRKDAPPRLIYLDTETTGLDPRADRLVLAGFAADDSDVVVLCHDSPGASRPQLALESVSADDREEIQRWLDLPSLFCGHNIGFDMHFLECAGYRIPDPSRWVDTVLVAHVAGERLPGQTALRRLTGKLIEAGQLPSDTLEPEHALNAWLRTARRDARKKGWRRPEKGDAPRELLDPYLAADVVSTRAVRAGTTAPASTVRRRCSSSSSAACRRSTPPSVVASRSTSTPLASCATAPRSTSPTCGRDCSSWPGHPFNLNAAKQIEAVLLERGATSQRRPAHAEGGHADVHRGTLPGSTTSSPRAARVPGGEEAERLRRGPLAARARRSAVRHFRQVGTETGRCPPAGRTCRTSRSPTCGCATRSAPAKARCWSAPTWTASSCACSPATRRAGRSSGRSRTGSTCTSRPPTRAGSTATRASG